MTAPKQMTASYLPLSAERVHRSRDQLRGDEFVEARANDADLEALCNEISFECVHVISFRLLGTVVSFSKAQLPDSLVN